MHRHAQTTELRNIKPSLRRMDPPPQDSQFGGQLPERAAKRSLRSAILAFWQGVNTPNRCDVIRDQAHHHARQLAYRAGMRL